MMRTNAQKAIFKRGSKTYYNSSLFFPRKVWKDVTDLYAFVRVADDFVDAVPQDAAGFHNFCSQYRQAWNSGNQAADTVIDNFISLQKRKQFDPAWTESFLHSMELDLTRKTCETIDETLEYIYGSAEVIGLYMNRVMGISEKADFLAMRLGRAMQYINFIRDIDEDAAFGRRYLPDPPPELAQLNHDSARRHPDLFNSYIRDQLKRYQTWQNEAEQGYRYLPYRYRVPVKTAADMYNWTAKVIRNNPAVVFQRKVKPAKSRIILCGLHNLLTAAGTGLAR